MTHVLDANIAAFSAHLDTFVDPDLVAIDQELLDGRTNATVLARWEAWNAVSRALQEAITTNPQEVACLLGTLGDATGDLMAATDAAALKRGIGLACALRPYPAHLDGISTFAAFQMVPLPGVAGGA